MTEVGALKPLLCSAWVNNSLQIVWLKWGTQCISLKLSSKIQSIAIVVYNIILCRYVPLFLGAFCSQSLTANKTALNQLLLKS